VDKTGANRSAVENRLQAASMNVPEIVLEYIRKMNLLDPQETVLAAVSGGADSLCLLLVLKELGFPVSVGHFDHGLRAESARDSDTVQRYAETLKIPCHVGHGDVRGHAERKRMTLEEAARELRYDFLFRTASECRAPVVATGHTMDDQAETVLMHLVRGSGLDGLRGIRPDSRASGNGERVRTTRIRLIRPILCLTHAQTIEYCLQKSWQPIEDPSNRDPSFARNRIRRELIPHLREYNPEIVATLCRLSEIAAAHTEYMDRAMDEIWRGSMRETQPGLIRISRDTFNRSPLAVRQGMVRRAIGEITGATRDLAYRHVNRVIEFSLSPTSTRRMNLALGIDVSIEADSLVLGKHEGIPRLPAWENLPLPLPGWVSIEHPHWKFTIAGNEESGLARSEESKDPWTVRIDGDQIHPPLQLRKRTTGDRFFPTGMPGPVKLNDFLSSHHLPQRERDHWPLVCDGEGILWIPGFRLREGTAFSDASTRCVEIHVDRLP
jgi:tRNA(Ile)-lysidine synthase